MQQVVFLTVFLGLVAGRQPVELIVPDGVARVQIVLDDQVVRTLKSAPWKTMVDFGTAPLPRRLEARAYDASGTLVGTARQKINLTGAPSDLKIVREGNVARLIFADVDARAPKAIEARLDGARVPIREGTIPLPKIDDSRMHLLEVSATTELGELDAQLVFGGLYEDVANAELTAIPVRVRGDTRVEDLRCSARGTEVRCAGIDDLPGEVILVRSPSPDEAALRLNPRSTRADGRYAEGVDPGALLGDDGARFLWPVGREGQGSDAAMLFYSSRLYVQTDLRLMLTRLAPLGQYKQLRFADAVAVAGLQLAHSQRPRAVVLVLGKDADASRLTAPESREYLARLGVPLYIWSLIDPKKVILAAAQGWGPVVDVSSSKKLHDAVETLRQDLDAQRMLWVGGDFLPEEVAVSGEGVETIAKRR